MARLFAGGDHHGRYVVTDTTPEGKLVGDARTLPGAPTHEMWRNHLAGKERLGVIPIRRDGTVQWGAIDIDLKDKPDHATILRKLEAHHLLSLLVCRSKSNAAHVYLFCLEPITASKMQMRLREIAKLIGHAKAEVFPKQISLIDEDTGKEQTGNWINMPCYGDTCHALCLAGNELMIIELDKFLNYAESTRGEHSPEWFDQPVEGLPEITKHKSTKPPFEFPPTPISEDRNITLTSIGGHWREQGYAIEEIVCGLYAVNDQLCSTPLEHDEIDKTMGNSLAHYKPGATLPANLNFDDVLEGAQREYTAGVPEEITKVLLLEVASRRGNIDPEQVAAEVAKAYKMPKRERSKFGFWVHDGKIYHAKQEKDERVVTYVSSLVHVVGEARTETSEGWSLLINIRGGDGTTRDRLLPKNLLAEPKELTKYLIERGADVEDSRLLIRYLRQQQGSGKWMKLVERSGWQAEFSTFVLPSGAFGRVKETYRLRADNPDHTFRVSGTLGSWQREAAALCVNNSRMVLAVSCAFAGPLLPLSESTACPAFHLYGPTSRGKTTSSHAAGSVWGGHPRTTGYLDSWKSTANGLEILAAEHNHGLLVLDELREVKDPKIAVAAIYSLGGGKGTTRMTKNIEKRADLIWQLVVLSSGELTFEDLARECGRRSYGGQEVRMLDIPALVGQHGVFEDLHGEKDGKAFSTRVVRAARTHYGTAIRAFLDKLAGDREKIATRYKELVNQFDEEWSKGITEAQIGRAVKHFALMAGAGELATELGVTAWQPGAAAEGVKICLDAWLDTRSGGRAGSSDKQAMLAFVRELIERHGTGRFQDLDKKTVVTRSGGEVQADPRTDVRDRLGFRWSEGGHPAYFILPEVFQTECAQRGFNREEVVKALLENKMLRRGDGKNLQFQKRIPKEGHQRGYLIVLGDDPGQMDLREAA